MTAFATILLTLVFAGLLGSAIYGMWWAARRGQFSNFEKGATSIFDDEEPIGYRTDAFPNEAERKEYR